MNSKISVIIPVYNVAPYLKKCLDSVCMQTHDNLEIIIVDDGSTDESGTVCDDYADRDPRIIVIHKENGGLSDARNAGMAIASGDYIGFVDSDDWIETDMYERLYRLCEDNDIDFVIARFLEEKKGVTNHSSFTEKFVIMDSYSVLRICTMGDDRYVITNAVWNKLYKRSLLEDLIFPKGKNYEDIVFTTEVLMRARKVGYLDSVVYHYRIREDSIMGVGLKNQKVFSNDIITDLLPQIKEKARLLNEAGMEELGEHCYYQYLIEVLRGLEKTHHIKIYESQYSYLKQEFYLYRNWIKTYIRKDINKREKAILGISCLSIEFYILIVKVKRKIKELLRKK